MRASVHPGRALFEKLYRMRPSFAFIDDEVRACTMCMHGPCPCHARTMPAPCPHQVRAYTSVPDCACLTCSSNWRAGAGRQLRPCPAITAWLAQAVETNAHW